MYVRMHARMKTLVTLGIINCLSIFQSRKKLRFSTEMPSQSSTVELLKALTYSFHKYELNNQHLKCIAST